MVTILEPAQYNLIFKLSFLSAGTHAYAVYNRHYLISICPAAVFLTSINYWRKPEICWRRNLDISCVMASLFYQIYRAQNSQYKLQYYTIKFFAVSMYPVSFYYYNKNLWWNSTYAHCALHIISNIASLVLYSGDL